MNIHIDNPLQSLTKQTLTTLNHDNLNNNNGYFYVLLLHRAHSPFTKKNNNGVNIELGKTNRLNALCMMQKKKNQNIIALIPTSMFQSLSCCCCCCRPHSTNVLPAESSTRIMWQPTVSPPRWQGKAPLCRDSSRGPG